ncbi:hypothetical protein P153DRAFT_420491 [Dothidotthia symphoricarpi CBS 119687]|uniref:Rhodopsin domain-containing protein n=1 Tax=Dothidotthia symphoricarpi CBS 119687 TaxID=1392245 RepID=A0A6A6ANH9_9PLEO|nr:uncharacterized protein P153DRAFT_420491 [Dothidotthia symphoricarpi CBS 119687]KAF2132494.1 hypothetical protein P153DRAFT_420491 [Dothidotthia symphoricarpi CBS 119687]
MALTYPDVMTLVWVLWATSFLLTALRGFLRWHSQRHIYADDYFVFFGLLTLTGLSVVITKVLPQFFLAGGYAKAAMLDPTTPLPLPAAEFSQRTQTALKLMFSQMLLFWTTLWAAKFSILFFFRRLVNGLPKYIKAWWACFIVVSLLYLACILSNFLTCQPLTKYWSATGCSDPEDLVRADASIKFATAADVVADVLIMVLPLHLLRKLQVSARQKFGLAVIFSLGTIIVAFAFARLAQVTKATSAAARDPTTIAEGPVLLSTWSHIESSVSVIVATLPAFRYLINENVGRTIGPSGVAGYGNSRDKDTSTRSRAKRVLSTRHKSSMRLHSSERSGTRSEEWGSETELKSMDGIGKNVDYGVAHAPHAL